MRESDYWEDTLLLIVYDEHGGFYDHVVPPTNVSNPNPEIEPATPFDFTRLGIRVPAIAISPWLKKTIVSTQLEHASIPHTVKDIFNLKSDYLNIRDKEANPFITDDLILDEMRDDCITGLPEPPSFLKEPLHINNIVTSNPTSEAFVMGTILVKDGYLSKEIYESIIKTVHTDSDSM